MNDDANRGIARGCSPDAAAAEAVYVELSPLPRHRALVDHVYILRDCGVLTSPKRRVFASPFHDIRFIHPAGASRPSRWRRTDVRPRFGSEARWRPIHGLMVGIRCLALSALAEAEHCDGVPTVLTEAAIANRGTETQLDDIARRLDACVDALQGDIRQPKRGTGAAAAPLPAALSRSRSVASVASAAGVSARTLQRRVLRETGVTPKRLMALQRFSDAARDVALSARSIADIALDAGYADQAHLTTEFNRHAATSPGRLRAEADRIVLTDSVRFFKDPVLRSRVRLLITDHP